MKRNTVSIIILAVGITTISALTRQGIPPRPDASDYAVSAKGNGLVVGASLLTENEIRRTFTAGIYKKYLVVEIALYPSQGQSVELSLKDFAVTAKNLPSPIPAAEPVTVASSLYKSAKSGRTVAVTPSSHVGYQSGGYDPNTGERIGGGVYTSTNVDVYLDKGAGPGSTPADHTVMVQELTDKGLPEGKTYTPVSGHLYFPLPAKGEKGVYQLECTWKDQKIVLDLKPLKLN